LALSGWQIQGADSSYEKLLGDMDMALPVVNATAVVLARVSAAFNAPLARAVVFGVHIDGHLVVEGLLIAVIVFQLTRKSYKPPKKPLTEKVRCSSHC
jgi:serine palmitoyltransferase